MNFRHVVVIVVILAVGYFAGVRYPAWGNKLAAKVGV